MTLNHPDEDSHGTVRWLETQGNDRGTIVYQDTRGDQVSIRCPEATFRPGRNFERVSSHIEVVHMYML